MGLSFKRYRSRSISISAFVMLLFVASCFGLICFVFFCFDYRNANYVIIKALTCFACNRLFFSVPSSRSALFGISLNKCSKTTDMEIQSIHTKAIFDAHLIEFTIEILWIYRLWNIYYPFIHSAKLDCCWLVVRSIFGGWNGVLGYFFRFFKPILETVLCY